GVVAAEIIRKHAPADEIVLVGAEPEPPYSRMAIPYLLTGEIDEAGTHLRKDPAHFDRLGIRLRTARATAVDAKGGAVSLDDGSRLPFDRLLVATGSVPLRPPIPGLDLPGVHPCWTLADARQIMALARPGARVVQLGAGFIGCIIMEALAERGVKLTVVEMGDRMVPRMMGPGAGGMIKRWVEKKGVAVHTSSRIESIAAGQGAPLEVTLTGGRKVPAELVIVSAGVQPNVAFLQGSGIACDRGVMTDARMQTNLPGIFAAGDCAEAMDLVTGKPQVSAIQPNAADQAACAALNMVGRETRMGGVTVINVLDTLGLVSTSFGQWQGVPGGDHVERTDEAGFKHLRLEFDGDVLVGANTIGHTEHVGVIRGLIQSRVHLGEWKEHLLRDPTRLAEAYLARAQAQDRRPGRAA
ncbi:MAG TPA: FAD-dependent oxidoreductase, partial [Anaeromyxobacteraceae bacterium]|nr:FAD-dependent oxidoreductase [Anaeromyxobacteraceae bacterium]